MCSETLGKLGFSGPKNDSDPTRFGFSGNFRVFGQFRVGSGFGRAAQKFLVSGRASVGLPVNFCPNGQPCFNSTQLKLGPLNLAQLQLKLNF